ncbi:C1 family peptidase [Methanobrevibacter sp.]|uniref:C1 family peptidase n=1 Tax=Methanobrevibacter sp. TaxID=66852 RepID=UPI00386EA4B0
MLKKRYFLLIMIFCLFFISTANAEEINGTISDDSQLSVVDENVNHLPLTNESNADDFTGTEVDSKLESSNAIYFDASAKSNGDGSKSNPYKNINQNTLNKYTNSANTLTAYFANGNYNLNYNFIIKSPNVVFIGSENTVFKSVLSNKYDFEIMENANLKLANITFYNINIINHGTLNAYNSDFIASTSFTGLNAPKTYNTSKYDSSYGGVIICDPIGNSRPSVYLENCVFYNNSAYCGGAISLKNSQLTVNNSQFHLSEAKRKGGAFYGLNSDINIFDSYFSINNATYGGVIYSEKCDINLKNTNLYLSVAESFGGAIASKYSNIDIDSCSFDLYGSFTDSGGAFYNFKGNLNINNSKFYRGKAEFGAAVCNLQSNLTILSSIFKNNTGGIGGVIYNMYGKMYIENNTFQNSTAFVGSVICSKLSDISYIINNTFIDSPTRTNSSCILLDACGEELIQYGNHFEDRFYIKIEINDNINGNEFALNSNILTYILSNTGTYYGNYEIIDNGGGFSNYADVNIYDFNYPNNSTIFRNYNDDFEVKFDLTTYTGEFNNPMFKIKLYNNIWDLIDELPIYVDGKLGTGTGSFPRSMKSHMLIDAKEMRLTVEQALTSPINSTLSNLNYIPYSYDSRDYGYITPVKSQGEGGNCWAFAGIATLEACIKKVTGITYDFSEENVKNMMAAFSTMGLDIQPNIGGFDAMVMGYLTSWFGPVVEETDKYDEFSSLSNTFEPKFHIQNICFLPPRENGKYDYVYKKAIMDYGAVAVTFEVPKTKGDLHSVSIVGWNDNYNNIDSLGKFTKGAWIFKNSWGTDWGDEGFGYISYNTHFTSDDYINWHAYSFVFNENDNYNINVHPDFSGVNNYIVNDGPITCSIKVNGPKNVYTRLSALGTYFKYPTEYTIEIRDLNRYEALIFTQDGYSQAGYYTIPLYRSVLVNPNDSYLISIKFNNDDLNYLPVCMAEKLTLAHFQEYGQFFYDDGYGYRQDLLNLRGFHTYLYNGTLSNTCQVPSIHLYTNNVFPYETLINVSEFEIVNVGESVNISITFDNLWSVTNLYYDTIQMIEGSLITLNIEGENYYAMIHDGKASVNIRFDKGGVYTLSAQYKNNKFTSNVVEFDFEVKKGKSVLSAKSVSKVYGGSEKSVVTLKDNMGNPIPNTVITFNINGKSTAIKTNAKGQATMALSLAPNSYTATVSYGGNDIYSNASAKAKVVIKKATPKIIASKKTFNVKAKTKKYTITLKNNLGKVMKNTKVTLKIKSKTYTAKTNKKGQATFTVKLTKKGNYKATVKYGGSNLYNKVSKNVSIVVKK